MSQANCDAEFDQFYRDYWARLLRFVRQTAHTNGLTEARLDTESVTQDTFEAAFKGWATIDHPERWIYTVAVTKVRRHFCQESKHQELIRLLEAVCPNDSDEDPVCTTIVADQIVEAILALPTNQRIATYLCRVEGWKAAEIAEFLGIKRATAYVHIHKGTLKVRHSERVIPCAHTSPIKISIPRASVGSPIREAGVVRLVALVVLGRLALISLVAWAATAALWLGVISAVILAMGMTWAVPKIRHHETARRRSNVARNDLGEHQTDLPPTPILQLMVAHELQDIINLLNAGHLSAGRSGTEFETLAREAKEILDDVLNVDLSNEQGAASRLIHIYQNSVGPLSARIPQLETVQRHTNVARNDPGEDRAEPAPAPILQLFVVYQLQGIIELLNAGRLSAGRSETEFDTLTREATEILDDVVNVDLSNEQDASSRLERIFQTSVLPLCERAMEQVLP